MFIKSLISYIISVALSILYMYFLDEESGLIITAILITAPLISLILTFVNMKTTGIEFKPSSDIINSGDILNLQVDIKRKLPIISPVITIDISMDANFAEYPQVSLRFFPEFKRESHKAILLKALYSTNAAICVDSIVFSDFLGIFNLKSKCKNLKYNISIVPKINHSDNENMLFDAFSSNLSYDDEQETSSNPFSVHTTAGYEHREYVESDPLKRINWKLSSKIGKLMIRLDDAVCASKPIFIIDLTAREELIQITNSDFGEQKRVLAAGLYKRADRLISNSLGTLKYFVNHGIECKVYCTGMPEPIICSNDSDIARLAVEISRRSISDSVQKSQLDSVLSSIDSETNIVYFSFSHFPAISKLLSACNNANANAAIVLASNETKLNFSGICAYYYDSNNSLSAI